MKVSKKSKYQTHEKPKRRNWRAKCQLARAPGALKEVVAKHQKIEGCKKIGEKNSEKSLTMPKKLKGGRESLVSPGMVYYAEKEGKPFWFSTLGQTIQFETIKFCRTFVELFWSVRVD